MQREQSVWPRPDYTSPQRLKPSLSLTVLDLIAATSTQPCNTAATKTLVGLGYATAAKTLAWPDKAAPPRRLTQLQIVGAATVLNLKSICTAAKFHSIISIELRNKYLILAVIQN